MPHGTGRGYASDIQLILQRSKVSKDTRITLPFLISRMADWRAKEMHDMWKRNANDDVNPEWIQDMGMMKFTQVGSGDDPAIPAHCNFLGKLTIPQVVSIPGDRGVFRIAAASKYDRYYPIEADRFFELEPGTVRAKFSYAFRMGTALYASPFQEKMSVMLLLLDPLEGFVIQTENVLSGELIYANDFRQAEVYKVESGGITHNGNLYTQGQTFTAVGPDFTGNGVLKFNNQKRRMTLDDVYPMSGDLATAVAMRIWTHDFELEKKEVADIINDAQDQLLALQPV